MKNLFLCCFLIIGAANISKGQTTIAAGTVNDDKGGPLRYVFVEDAAYKNAAFTDSLGNFSIAAHPDSKLQFDLPGYTGTSAVPNKGNSLQIVLKTSTSGNASRAIASQVVTIKHDNIDATIGDGGYIAPSHQKGNLKGNLYLFNIFVHGYIIGSDGNLIYSSGYLYAYDKIEGSLLLSPDKKNLSYVDKDKINSFVLYSPADQRYAFEKAPLIDRSHFVRVLASGSKYKIYEQISTKFIKSDYVNSGVVSHGNDYDEYADDYTYYLLDVQSNQLQKISLKKKAIKTAFAKEPDKVNKYFADNSGDIDDNYLGGLGDYMNK